MLVIRAISLTVLNSSQQWSAIVSCRLCVSPSRINPHCTGETLDGQSSINPPSGGTAIPIRRQSRRRFRTLKTTSYIIPLSSPSTIRGRRGSKPRCNADTLFGDIERDPSVLFSAQRSRLVAEVQTPFTPQTPNLSCRGINQG